MTPVWLFGNFSSVSFEKLSQVNRTTSGNIDCVIKKHFSWTSWGPGRSGEEKLRFIFAGE